MARSNHGFTLIEMITLVILIGVLAAVAIPKLESSAFSERGFRDGVFTTLAHARRVAVAGRRFVCVSLVAGTGAAATVSVSEDVGTSPETAASINCTQAVALSAQFSGCAANQLCAPRGVTLGGSSSVKFDALGRSVSAPNTTASATITVSNQPDITVAAETGYVQ